jgi:hypothetical protein
LVFRELLEGGRNGYQQTGRRQCPERRSPEAHPASQQDHGESSWTKRDKNTGKFMDQKKAAKKNG